MALVTPLSNALLTGPPPLARGVGTASRARRSRAGSGCM